MNAPVPHAKSNPNDFDRLLIEAGSLARNWKSATFRDHASREADRTFIPPTDEIGAARFLLAKALRDVMRVMPKLDDDARAHAAVALSALLSAIRARNSEPATAISRASTDTAPYWIGP